MTNNFVFEADLDAKTIHMIREFNAPIEKLWKAWTEPALVEKWIAPKPWRVETKVADLRVGGVWLYLMVGTEGEKHWVYDVYTAVEKEKLIASTGMFCDDEGNPKSDGPKTFVTTKFSAIDGNRSQVDTTIIFDDEATIKWFVEGGFKEGTAATHAQLDELLASE